MTDTGSSDWRGRRTNSSESKSNSVDGPVPDWKQRKQTTPIPVRRRSFKRLILPVAILAALVTGGVLMYIATLRHRTHFVVTELLYESEPAKRRNFDTKLLPEFPSAEERTLQITTKSRTLTSLQGASIKLNNPHVVVLYVQALLSPTIQNVGGDEFVREPEPQFLIQTSSPDVNVGQVSGISRLKELVDQLRQQCRTGLLLILDFPDHPTTWRLGLPHAAVSGTLLKKIEEWTSEQPPDKPKLVALVACNRGQISTGGSTASFGRTAFAESVTRGFSKDADVHPADGQLSVAEFAEYVEQETERLVAGLRGEGTQSVRMIPRIKVQENEESTDDFVLLKELPAPPELQPKDSGSTVVSDLDAAFRKRAELQRRQAYRWNPLAWNAAGEYLCRAELFCLDGNLSAAADRLSAARDYLTYVEDSDKKCVFGQSEIPPESTAEEINDRWIAQLKEGLPDSSAGSSDSKGSGKSDNKSSDASVAQGKADTSSQKPSETNTSVPTSFSQEDILRASITAFPFEAMALPRPIGDEVEPLVDCRRRVERAFESLPGGPEVMKTTLLSLHREVLAQTDRLFISTPSPGKAEQNEVLNHTKDTADAAAEFAAEWRLTEGILHDAMSRLSGDLRWAAGIQLRLDTLQQNRWIDFLTELLQLSEIDPDQCRDLCGRAMSLAELSDSESSFGLFRLQGRILSVAISARGLQQQMRTLDSDESRKKQFDAAQFHQMTSMLARWRTELKDTLLKQLDAEISACTSDLLNIQGQKRQAAVTLLRSTLLLSSLSSDQHKRIREQIESWESELRKASLTKTSNTTRRATRQDSEDATESLVPTSDDQLHEAWMMQLFSFLPASIRSPKLTPSELKNKSLGDISVFAAAARESWQKCRLEIQDATETESRNGGRLRDALMLSHLLTAFDADELFRRHAPGTLTDSWIRSHRFEYCRFQAEKCVQDRWIHVNDNLKTRVEETWYGQQVETWTSAAAQVLQEAPGDVPEIRELQKQMRDAYELSFTSVIKSDGIVDLTDQNRTRETINVETSLKTALEPANDAAESLQAALTLRTSSGALQATGLARVSDNAKPLLIARNTRQGRQSFMIERLPQQGNGCSQFECRPHVFFRGREWDGQNTIMVNPCEPGSIDRIFPARKPTADVRVVGQDIRPIVFILDRSRSMTKTVGNTGQPRYQVALDTLKNLIRRGTLLSPETPVTLKVYGHRFATGNLKNPAYKTLYPNASDNPGGPNSPDKSLLDYKNEFRGRLTEDGLKEFQIALNYLENSEPWGSTPLASSITEALNTDLNGESGIVIAITDGEAKDVGEVKPADFPTLQNQPEALDKAVNDAKEENNGRLKRLKDVVAKSQSKVSIVAFDLQGAPDERKERKALDDIFKNECGFEVVDAANESEIRKRIEDSLPARKWTIANGNLPEFGEQHLELGQTVTGLQPAPGYNVTFGKTSPKSLELLAGDLVTLRVEANNREFSFERPNSEFFSAAKQPNIGPDPSRLEWLKLLSSFPNTEPIAGRKQYKVTLELQFNHTDETQPVEQPLECHLEFRTPAQASAHSTEFSERPKSIRQEFTSERGTPGYSVLIDSWPADSNILVDAWWKMTRTEPDCVRLGSELVQADTATSALLIGGDSTLLPPCRVWSARQADGTIQIRIDRQEGKPYAEGNAPQDVIVQLGTRGTTGNNKDFVPRELTTEIQQLETGSVIYKFRGLRAAEGLQDLEAAFTSLASRKKDAITLKDPLKINTPSNPN